MTVLTPWKVICQVNLLDFFLEDVQLVEKEDDGRVFEPGHAYDFLQEPLGLLHPVGGLVLKEDLQSVVVGERNILTDVSSKILRDLALSVISNRKKPAKIAQTVGELFKRCNLFFSFPKLCCFTQLPSLYADGKSAQSWREAVEQTFVNGFLLSKVDFSRKSRLYSKALPTVG